MGQFCDYETGYAGKCGIYIEKGTRCKLHLNKTSQKPRKKQIKYSGFSRYRQESGEFQSRRES